MLDKYLKLDKDNQNIYALVILMFVISLGMVAFYITAFSALKTSTGGLQMLDDLTLTGFVFAGVMILGYSICVKILKNERKKLEEEKREEVVNKIK